MSVVRAVQGALSVRPQEGRLVQLLLVHSFFVGIPRVLTSTAAMALFLAHFDATELPYVYMAAAVAIPCSGFFRLSLASRLSLGRLLAVDLVFVFVALLAFRAALMSPWVVLVAMVLPVWAEVEWVVLNLEFWGLAGHLMNVRQAKRLFGLIGAGELAAGGLVGFLVPAIVERLGTSNLLLLSAGSVVGCGALLGLISRTFALQPAPAPRPEDRVERRPRYAELLRSRYLGLIFALVGVSYFGYYVVDNAFYGLAEDQYPNADHLASFLGIFWAVASLITLLSRALATSRLLTRYGLVGGCSRCLSPSLSERRSSRPVGSSRLASWSSSGAWPSPSWSTRRSGSPWTEAPSSSCTNRSRLGSGCGRRPRSRASSAPSREVSRAWCCCSCSRCSRFEVVHLAGLLLLLVAAWATVAWLLRHEYAKVLAKALASRRLSGVALTLEDASSVAVLQNGLSSPHPGEVLYCLNTLEELGHPSFESSLLELVKHPAAAVRREALLRLERLRLASALGVVRLAVVEEEDASVRSAAIRALTAVGEPEDLDKAIACLDDPDAEIRLGAMAGLLRNGGIEGVLIAGERLDGRGSGRAGVTALARRTADRRGGGLELSQAAAEPARGRGRRGAARRSDARRPRSRTRGSGRWRSTRSPSRSSARWRWRRSSPAATGSWGFWKGPTRPQSGRGIVPASAAPCASAARSAARARRTYCGGRPTALTARCGIRSFPRCCLIGFKADTDQAQIVRERIVSEVSEAAGILAAIEDLRDGETLDLVTGTLEHALERGRERIFCLLAFVIPPTRSSRPVST